METQYKALEIGNLRPFAKGGTGECFCLDEETILKLYYEDFPLEYIRREKDGARTALVAGVPTAISFDPVRVGNRYGVEYERVQGKTLSERTAREPFRARALGGNLARIARILHSAEVRRGGLPKATEHIRTVLPRVDYAPESAVRRIAAFLDDLDREKGYVHGDFHPNNVIITADGPMLIDMGDFALGSPIFDLATLRFSLFASPEAQMGGRNTFNGLTREEATAFWLGFEQTYFGGGMDRRTAKRLEKVLLLKKLRFERLFGMYFSEEYCEKIREEVRETFGGTAGVRPA